MHDESSYTVPRMDPQQVRNERLKIARELLALTLRDVAVLPTRQQEQVRQAMRNLTDVQQWCRTHSEFSAHG
jgi:hypothetical protein